MKRKIRGGVKNLLVATPGFLALFEWYTRNTPKILMMHRFCHSRSQNPHGMSEPSFQRQLRYLAKGKWNVISLQQYLEMRRSDQRIPPYTVILTIDDGYRDFFEIGYPLLRKFSMTATFFVTTRFVDGGFWLWHDRLDYALRHTKKKSFFIDFPSERRNLDLRSPADVNSAWQLFSDYCVSVKDGEKWQMIHRLEDTLEVSITESVPQEYVAATWEQLREMREQGIEVGAHSVSHPILSKISPERLKIEIEGSKNAIESELQQPIVSFCYPNGREEDINGQVIDHVRKAGFWGATHGTHLDFSNLYRLPRMGIGNDMVDFHWKVSGLEMSLNNY